MKKLILILTVAGIFLLSLSSCARTCKGGSCPSWSDASQPVDLNQFEFLDVVRCERNSIEANPKA